ncbi:hypothetical protein BU17DRAFT_61047 [Hysterangium stoloniferum]|nr:hypothetical protein BU17DRAFT_61047 [Hysterangium stoloniferum]
MTAEYWSKKETRVRGGASGSEILWREGLVEKAIIISDNQAGIQATDITGSQLGHNLVEPARRAKSGVLIAVQWLPGHAEVERNELADEKAEGITRGDRSPLGIFQAY